MVAPLDSLLKQNPYPVEAATEVGCHMVYPRSCNHNQRSAGVVVGYAAVVWTILRSASALISQGVREGMRVWQRSAKDTPTGISSGRVTRKPDTPSGVRVKATTSGSRAGKHKNHHSPDPNATGAHSVWRRTDPKNPNRVSSYETFQPQSNPRNPNPWESVKRFDGVGDTKGHYNKVLEKDIPEPHVHDPKYPGVIREPALWEFPEGY